MKKWIVLLLIAAMAFQLVACGTQGDDETEAVTDVSTEAATDAATEEATEAETADPSMHKLSEDLDFGGITSHIFGWDGAANEEFFVEVADGDIVNDAVVARNMAVEERLNIILNPDPQLDFTGKPITTMVTAELTGSVAREGIPVKPSRIIFTTNAII